MTKVKDILSISLENEITSVVDINSKGQDEDAKISELNEFILTESLAKHLTDFCDHFCSDTKQPGVWLSGFYGSGKSFFAKILGYLLENPTWKGTSVRDRFSPKLDGLSNASLLQNDIDELMKTHNHVVKFDAAKNTSKNGVSFMLMSNFLRSLGLLGTRIGLWEYDMINNGTYSEFCDRVMETEGETWNFLKADRSKAFKILRKTLTDWNYTEKEFDETLKDYEQHISTYDADKLASDLGKYIENNPDIHIVFLLDEISEAINQKKIHIDELEGMAEALWTFGNKVWTIAIAQLQLDDVINDANVNQNAVTKLIDRFKNGINIDAEEVDTIIRRRLLAKNEEGKSRLTDYYNKKSGPIGDCTNIGGGLKRTSDPTLFSDYYPFYEYQFKMLQYFLFGNRKLVKTQVGTRGMLISTFDVLKKEAMRDAELYKTVNSVQLCNQAEENIDPTLANRYNQAEDIIKNETLHYVHGMALLKVIHFLAGAEVINTTVENITKSFISDVDDYYDVLADVKKALNILVDNRVLIFSSGQYRITSETELRILDKKKKIEEEIPSYKINATASKELQRMQFVKSMQNTDVGGLKAEFYVGIRDGESFANAGMDSMKILLSGLFQVSPSFNEYVESIKESTQTSKGEMNIIPVSEYNDRIFSLERDLISIEYIENDTAYTPEEKKVIANLTDTKEDKHNNLVELIRKAYTEGQLVYCYNTYNLSPEKVSVQINELQNKMYDNIFTRRLSGSLTDDLARKVITMRDNQLTNLFGSSPDFTFFDSTGKFIGGNLSVVTEITDLSKSYITGADLEKRLQAPPTGFTFGTIVAAVAALFRGNKMIIKFNGSEYHSYKESGAEDVFSSTKNFSKSSFKSVTEVLTYNEHQEIADTLKEDCHYNQWTNGKISYQMNDFELVDAIRTLSMRVRDSVSNIIMGDNEKERLFQDSVKAYKNLADYVGTVTDINYINTAKRFLNEINNKAFVSDVGNVDKDINFINNNFSAIKNQQRYFLDVEKELTLSNIDTSAFRPMKDDFDAKCRENLVSNFTIMKGVTQKLSDYYHDLMKRASDDIKKHYLKIIDRLEDFLLELEHYDREWNEELFRKAKDLEQQCKKMINIKVELGNYAVDDKSSGLALHDIVNNIKLSSSHFTEIDVWESLIRKSKPNPAVSGPVPTAPNPLTSSTTEPQVVKMRDKMPHGQKKAGDYRDWLKSQLALTNSLKEDDIINFDE
ncbi:MAG: BREX system P-loop protein BrxC [Bacteroidales bacterium]